MRRRATLAAPSGASASPRRRAAPCAAGERATLWLGPDEYLLLDLAPQDGSALATAASIEAALHDSPHALVDVSHRQFALEVSGPYAEIILRGACPLDLHISQFPVGMCTRTVFAKADITSSGVRAKMRSTWRCGDRSRATSVDCCKRLPGSSTRLGRHSLCRRLAFKLPGYTHDAGAVTSAVAGGLLRSIGPAQDRPRRLGGATATRHPGRGTR